MKERERPIAPRKNEERETKQEKSFSPHLSKGRGGQVKDVVLRLFKRERPLYLCPPGRMTEDKDNKSFLAIQINGKSRKLKGKVKAVLYFSFIF